MMRWSSFERSISRVYVNITLFPSLERFVTASLKGYFQIDSLCCCVTDFYLIVGRDCLHPQSAGAWSVKTSSNRGNFQPPVTSPRAADKTDRHRCSGGYQAPRRCSCDGGNVCCKNLHLTFLFAELIIHSRHMCMTMRGVQKPGAITTTSCMLGCFRTQQKTREEFLTLIKR